MWPLSGDGLLPPLKGAEAGFRRAPLCAAGAAERSGDSRAGVGMGGLPQRPNQTHPILCGGSLCIANPFTLNVRETGRGAGFTRNRYIC